MKVAIDEFELVNDLVQSLEESKPYLPKTGTSQSKEKFLEDVFKPMYEKYEPYVLKNLRILINHHLFISKTDMDAVINFLRERNNYDARIVERESRDGFDLKYGTHTGTIESPYVNKDFSSDYELLNCTRTVPAGVEAFQSVLKHLENLNLDLSDYCFMDVGSGMGRNLLIASLYPFKSVIGVEISKAINDIAENNIQIFKHPGQKCADIKSYATDILNFALPDKNMVMFLFEPFSQSVFTKFYEGVQAKIREHDHHYILIFLGKTFTEMTNPSSIFKLVHSGLAEEIAATSYDLHFYSNKTVTL